MSEKLSIPIYIHPHADKSLLPNYATIGSAGMDLCAAIEKTVSLAPMQRIAIPTGISLALPVGYEAQIRARSGLALKQGLAVLNAPGTIDSDYRGEIAVILINLGQMDILIEPKMRIAQMIIAKYSQIDWEVSPKPLPPTDRGEGGFGSTGKFQK